MESANHEFTWMSGRAQWTSGCSTASPMALPAQHTKSSPKSHHQVVDSQTARNATANSQGLQTDHLSDSADMPDQPTMVNKSPCPLSIAKKPIPLPRIFRRLSYSPSATGSTSPSSLSSSSSTSDYSTPPQQMPALPQTNAASSAHVYDLPPANESQATFYIPAIVDHGNKETTTTTTTTTTMTTATATKIDISRVIFEFDPILQKRDIETQECDLYLPSETDPDFDVNDDGAAAAFVVSSAECPLPTRPTPKLRRNDVSVPDVVSLQSPKLPPKSLKVGLSTVPPPPASESAGIPPVMAPLNHGDVTLGQIATPKTISPIHIDNPCYMFLTPSEHLQDVETSSAGGNNSSKLKVSTDVFLKEPDANDLFTPPDAIIPSHATQCPPAPQRTYMAKRYISPSLSGEPPKFLSSLRCKIPIYQNLLELSGSREGVYAQIRKALVPPPPSSPLSAIAAEASAATKTTPEGPPPLPPRGQQRCSSNNVDNGSPTSRAVARTMSRRSAQLTEVIRSIPHRGQLLSIGRGRKDVTQKWAVMERGHLQLFTDDKFDNPKEIFHQSDIVSIGRSADVKHNHREMSCFELVSSTDKDRPSVFGTKYAHERDAWIQHVIQSVAPTDSLSEFTSNVNKAGYVQIRKAVSGVWHTHWMVLSGKKLGLWSTVDSSYLELDVRKVMFMQEYERDPQASMALTEDWPLFVLHYPALTLYVTSKVVHDLSDWYRRLQNASLDTGRGLDEQQLTHEDVPVIVDKCLKFVSTYGISTKGVYRESGTNSKISRLIESFQKDAWKVHIAPDEYSEHDVANVLKRFLRMLPEALLTKTLYQQWIASQTMTDVEAIPHYIHLLNQLPRINYMTLKKLVAHLKSVSEQNQLNLMDISNLAAIFGPTLLSTENDVMLSNTRAEVFVVSDLLTNYAQLFGVSTEEIEKEEKIQKALHELREARRAQKPAGDILVGIYIHSRQWGKCLNVKLSPTMTALDLCQYAIQQTRMRDRVENLVIFEVVCNDEMERPLHYSENVLGVTLRWACWSEADARDSYLLLRKSEIFHRIVPLARQPLSMFGELRFADVKSKSFKKFMFEFKNARLAYYKDAKISQPLGSWNIEDIAWYIGSDSQRPRPTEWSLSFIEQKAVIKRGTKETPYFGRTICFSSEEESYRWMAAMITGQYSNGILPRVDPVDLLT